MSETCWGKADGYRAGNHRFAGNDRLVEISRPMFSRLTEIGRP